MTRKSFHVGVAKRYLEIQRHPARWLEGFTGTDEEALAAIHADPRDTFTTPECDNQDALGRCLGHPCETVATDPAGCRQ